MRIDLPQCNLQTCRLYSDGNCTKKEHYEKCEYILIKKAAVVRHAHWDPDPVYFGAGADMLNGIGNDDNVLAHYKCSRCGRRISHLKEKRLSVEYPYCHCGAKMDEVVQE